MENENVPIWPDMKDAVGLFFALSTQWKWVGAGMAGAFRSGIDYNSIAPAALGLGLTMTPALFNDIRTLELAALDVWSKKHHG